MLSHKNIITNAKTSAAILAQNPVKTGLSFLPLCHVYERVINYTYQLAGVEIYYVHNLELIGEMIREVKPEMFCTVPRILEKTYAKIMSKGHDLPFISKIIFHWALSVGSQFEPWEKRSAWYNFKLSIARKLVFSKWIDAWAETLMWLFAVAQACRKTLQDNSGLQELRLWKVMD